MSAQIALIDDALIAIGATPLQVETAPNGPRYLRIYEIAIGELCAEYPWTFQTGFQQLAQLALKPVQNQWLYAYALPADTAGELQAVYDCVASGSLAASIPWAEFDQVNPPVKEFEVLGAVVYANYQQLWARYPKQPNPAAWPPYFRALAVKKLMAEYAIPAREDAPLRQVLMQEIYGPPDRQGESGLIAKCKALNSQGRPSRKIAIGISPLAAVRWS